MTELEQDLPMTELEQFDDYYEVLSMTELERAPVPSWDYLFMTELAH